MSDAPTYTVDDPDNDDESFEVRCLSDAECPALRVPGSVTEDLDDHDLTLALSINGTAYCTVDPSTLGELRGEIKALNDIIDGYKRKMDKIEAIAVVREIVPILRDHLPKRGNSGGMVEAVDDEPIIKLRYQGVHYTLTVKRT